MSDLALLFSDDAAAQSFLDATPGFVADPKARLLDAVYGPEPLTPDVDLDDLSRSRPTKASFRGHLSLDPSDTTEA